MDIFNKLKILTDSAKYDTSCSSSGSDRKNTNNGIGNGHVSGICHSWDADGRCISLFLMIAMIATNIIISFSFFYYFYSEKCSKQKRP